MTWLTWHLRAAHLDLLPPATIKQKTRHREQPTTSTSPLVQSGLADPPSALHQSPLVHSHRPAAMASRAGLPLRRWPPQRPALLAIAAVLCCLHLALHASASGDRREVAAAGAQAQAQRACTYTVEIKTSCSSPARSPDAVSLAFGDTYKNEVYAAMVTPARVGFQRCAKDTFRVSGPCGYGVCYLYLRRTGRVGWTPEWVRVYEPTSATPSTFYFGDPLANGVWYGTDRCLRRAAGGGAVADDAATARPMRQGQRTTGGAHAAVVV